MDALAGLWIEVLHPVNFMSVESLNDATALVGNLKQH